jgi:hypothetical protein
VDPTGELGVAGAVEAEFPGDLGQGGADPAGRDGGPDRRPVDLDRVVERRLLADDVLADDEPLLQGDLLEVFEKVGLAGPEVPGDQETGRSACLRSVLPHLAQSRPERLFDLRVGAAEGDHRDPVRHPGPQRLDRSPRLDSSVDVHPALQRSVLSAQCSESNAAGRRTRRPYAS